MMTQGSCAVCASLLIRIDSRECPNLSAFFSRVCVCVSVLCFIFVSVVFSFENEMCPVFVFLLKQNMQFIIITYSIQCYFRLCISMLCLYHTLNLFGLFFCCCCYSNARILYFLRLSQNHFFNSFPLFSRTLSLFFFDSQSISTHAYS